MISKLEINLKLYPYSNIEVFAKRTFIVSNTQKNSLKKGYVFSVSDTKDGELSFIQGKSESFRPFPKCCDDLNSFSKTFRCVKNIPLALNRSISEDLKHNKENVFRVFQVDINNNEIILKPFEDYLFENEKFTITNSHSEFHESELNTEQLIAFKTVGFLNNKGILTNKFHYLKLLEQQIKHAESMFFSEGVEAAKYTNRIKTPNNSWQYKSWKNGYDSVSS